MAVKIRFSRIGKKNRPYWRIIVVDSRKKRDGAFLDIIGTYDPFKHQVLQLDRDRVKAWVGKGAECSPAVLKLMKKEPAPAQAS